ncbi:MAG: DegT/DnrJ/EryC1/StrS aminotransferase family protein [Proteobacteria bacterium]|nr:DegT/DnrJ/EryC1/StrS aminotransferase family protein [Pseudomonadota bacterium]
MNAQQGGALPFIDLAAQRERLQPGLNEAIARVLAHGGFINGPEVKTFERELADFAGVAHAIGCGNGTDALYLPLLAHGLGAGDAVLVPSFTFVATAEVVVLTGATPVFVDVDADTFNVTADSMKAGIAEARRAGLRPRAMIPVDLFGLPADYDAINALANAEGMFVIADAAQSIGGSRAGHRVGGLATITSTSFFPSKPLGCYGDGGAILTNDDDLAEQLRSLRAHGGGKDKYDNIRVGVNSRLDTLQAAILSCKLAIFEDEIRVRGRVAARYNASLPSDVTTPRIFNDAVSAWAQYTVRVKKRDAVAADLKAKGIPTAVYYPKPLHLQQAYRGFPVASGGLAVSERLADEVLSLPMHPYLDEATQDRIVEGMRSAVNA